MREKYDRHENNARKGGILGVRLVRPNLKALLRCCATRLKRVNDEQVHEALDRLIVAAGKALGKSSLDAENIDRLRGDKFAVFVLNPPQDFDLARDRLQAA